MLMLGLICYALLDLVRAPRVRYLPKWLWALVITFGSAPLGALAYLVLGRSHRDNPDEQRSDRQDLDVDFVNDDGRDLTGRRLSSHGRGLRF